MLRKDTPETLIQLLAAYRPAKFTKSSSKPQKLVALARTIADNCAATIAFAGRALRRITEDNEEVFYLYEVRAEARRLKRRCAKLTSSARSVDARKEVESLRREYDNFTGSVRHMVGLLDPSLGERLDEIL